jgi:hypothetical protein
MPPTTLVSPFIPYMTTPEKTSVKPYNYTGVQAVIAFFVIFFGFAILAFALVMVKTQLDKRQKFAI